MAAKAERELHKEYYNALKAFYYETQAVISLVEDLHDTAVGYHRAQVFDQVYKHEPRAI